MARPSSNQPTPGELEVLKILWERGPSTVREVMGVLNQTRERAYTSVMSLLNVMADKGLLVRQPDGRAFVYEAAVQRDCTLAEMTGEFLDRVFEGSASSLVAHLLEQSEPSAKELSEIRKAISEYLQQGED